MNSHVILFAYMFAIFFIVAGITLVILARRRQKTALSGAFIAFSSGMLIMCFYDMLIYYTDYIVGNLDSLDVLRIGDCIIAVLVYLWILLADKLVDGTYYRGVNLTVRNYALIYAAFWCFCTIFVSGEKIYTMRWILLASDIFLMLLLLAGSIVYIGEAVWSRGDKIKVRYLIVVTAMLVWNYISYFWGETSVHWGNSTFIRAPLDLTILFWAVINIFTLFMAYKTLMGDFYSEERAVFNLDKRLEELQEEYSLTTREKELIRLIYEGRTNGDISEVLFISESTVKTHIYNIFRKLGVKNRTEVTCVVRGDPRG